MKNLYIILGDSGLCHFTGLFQERCLWRKIGQCSSSQCNSAREFNLNCYKWLAVVFGVVFALNYRLGYWMNTDSAALFFHSHSRPTRFLVCIVIWSEDVVLGGFD